MISVGTRSGATLGRDFRHLDRTRSVVRFVTELFYGRGIIAAAASCLHPAITEIYKTVSERFTRRHVTDVMWSDFPNERNFKVFPNNCLSYSQNM